MVGESLRWLSESHVLGEFHSLCLNSSLVGTYTVPVCALCSEIHDDGSTTTGDH